MTTPTAAAIARTEFSTTDPDVLRATCQAVFGASISGSVQTWQFAMNGTDTATLGVLNVQLSAEYIFHVKGQDTILIETMRHGRLETSGSGGERRHGPGDVFLGNYPEAYDGHCLGGTYHVGSLPASLIRTVAGLPDDARLNIRSSDVTPGAAARWHPVAQVADELLANPISAQSPLLLSSVGRVAAAAALDLIPTIDPPSARLADGHDSHTATLRRAIAFIEAHPDQDIGVVDIACAASVTPRAVQLAFRRHQDTTPMGYLRRVQLDRAHADLAATTAEDGTTVTAVAARWGFSRPSAFAALPPRVRRVTVVHPASLSIGPDPTSARPALGFERRVPRLPAGA